MTTLEMEVVLRLATVTTKARTIIEAAARCDALLRDGLDKTVYGLPAAEIVRQQSALMKYEAATLRSQLEIVLQKMERLACQPPAS